MDATPEPKTSVSGRSSPSDSVTASSSASSSPAVTDTTALSSTVAASQIVVKAPSATTWLSTVSTLSSVSTAPSALMTPSASLVTMQGATPAAATSTPAAAVLASVVNQVLNPFAGNAPAAPVDPPTPWVMLAAVRRELVTGPIAATGPITYVPNTTLVDGVITNSVQGVDSNGLPLTYTIVSAPSAGGKVNLNPATGTFTFLPYGTVASSGGTEQFSVLVSETTPFDTALEALPVVGSFVPQILVNLYQVPGWSTALAPLIGYAVVDPINVDVGAIVPAGAPVAFTVKVTSFDGTQISTNFFPASGLQAGQTAPTVLDAPGLGMPGNIDPNSLNSQLNPFNGIAPLRQNGYNVVTWDPRGEFASGGVFQLDSPFFEGRDVSSIIDWVAQQPEAQLDGPKDPRIGMVGGSYGGGIQLVTAAIDPRIDAIVPGITWNSLNSALYPNQAFKSSWATELVLLLTQMGARINPQFYSVILSGDLLGILTPSQQALLASSGPSVLVNNITAPTLLFQGTVDTLFTLQQAVTNAQMLAANGVPVKMVWYCGGHGTCLSTTDDASVIQKDTLAWLARYVKGDQSVSTGSTFEWVDQNGQHFSSNLLPSNPAFYGAPVLASGSGGMLPIVPILGGSGPQNLAPFPLSLTDGAKASNALNLNVSPPAGTQIVWAPELTLTYSGVGTSRSVYAQIVDDQTGLVLGNLVTPIPVTLDGQTHTVTVPLNDVAYTAPPGDTLTLQIVGSATPYENLTSVGVINVSSMQLALPAVGAGADAMPESSSELSAVA